MPANSIEAITVEDGEAERLAVRQANLAPAGPGEVSVRVHFAEPREAKRALTMTP